ncbi:TonB-dependent receptor [Pontibacter sp. 13R65]|uniref:TonB-dependent receptor n=1 Tax=Pontibacter sp. 13R65 TaxID=3127458 RepID=UPI00301BC41F
MKPKAHYSILRNAFILGATFATFPVAAQQFPADTLKVKNLCEVVVTTTRSAVEKNKTPQSIEVISQQDIELTPAQDFTDILKKNSTVNVIQYPGLSAGVGIRGFRPQFSGLNQRTLLLVDGRPAGTVNLATINPADIERVEVLKGPASALYGSQAMGGVVNVITRKSSGKIRSSVFAEYGSFETVKAGAITGGNITKKLDYDLSFTTFDRNRNMKLGEGNLFRDMLNAGTATKYYAEGPEEVDDSRGDGLRREYTRLNYNTGSLRLGYQLSSNWRVDVKGERFVAKNVEAPSDIAFGNEQPSIKDISRANGELSLSGNFRNHQLSLRGYTAEENNYNNTLVSRGAPIVPYLSFQSSTAWQGIQLKDVYQLNQHTIIAGVDHNNASTRSRSFNSDNTERTPYSPSYSLVSSAVYVQGQFRFLEEKLIVNPGARYDLITYNVKQTPLLNTYMPGKETNPFFSPSLAVQYQLLTPLTVHASIGRAFVTPDAYNVAGYSESVAANGKAAVTQGNPNLETENSTTWDAGLRFGKTGSGFTADITYFRTHVNDRITTIRTNPETAEYTESGYEIASRTTYVNANEANINGLEAEVGYDFGALQNHSYILRLFAGATSIRRAEEVTIASDGSATAKDIANVADLTMNYGLEYSNLKGLNLRLNGRYVGNRKDTDFNDPKYPIIEYPAFMVLDFSTAYTYAQQHTITLLVNNITDENYYEKRGYNMPGRNFTVRYGFTF